MRVKFTKGNTCQDDINYVLSDELLLNLPADKTLGEIVVCHGDNLFPHKKKIKFFLNDGEYKDGLQNRTLTVRKVENGIIIGNIPKPPDGLELKSVDIDIN